MINGCGTWAGVPYLCYTQLYLNCMTYLNSAIRNVVVSKLFRNAYLMYLWMYKYT